MNRPPVHNSELPISPVDPESPIPLYHQVEADLRELIRSGTLSPGDVLPPETELSRVYDVGRHTVRQALARLVADQLIERKAGRGTSVKKQPDRTRFYLDRSFTRQMADLGRTARSQVLTTATGTIDSNAPQPLQSKRGTDYFYLERLRFGDDEPVGLQAARIATDRCPDLEQHDFNRLSLYDVLSREYRLAITRIEHTVSATLADPQQAELLRVRAGDPLLVIKTAAFLDNDEIIEFTTSHYRADRYEYSTTHTYTGNNT